MKCCHSHTAFLPEYISYVHGFLLFRSIQFNPALAQQGKHWQSITYGVPAILCLCNSLNEGAKSLRAELLSWQGLLLPLTLSSRATLPLCPRRRQELHFQSAL